MDKPTISPPRKSAPSMDDGPVTTPKDRHGKARSILRRSNLWLFAVLLLAGAPAFALDGTVVKAKVHYTTSPVTRGNIVNTIVVAGVVHAVNYVDVGAQTSGELQSLKVKRGDQVKEGQLLAEIDPVLAKMALKSADSALADMTAQHSMNEDALVLAKTRNNRNEKLFKQGFVSADQLDFTRAALKMASCAVDSLSDKIAEATATVNAAKANLCYTKITAPMDGEIVNISARKGQTLNARLRTPTILRIADMRTMTVWARVPQADIVRVKPGQDVYFTILGDTRRWKGKIRQIRPTPQIINNVVFYDALFEVPNPDHELEIHMTAKVFISLPQARGVLLIPVAAIGDASAGTKTTVRVLKADGAVEQREITIGIKSEISAEVTDGLKEKELVVIGTVTAQKAVHTGKVQPG